MKSNFNASKVLNILKKVFEKLATLSRGKNFIETLLGAIVLFIALFFLIFAYSTVDLQTVEGYKVTTRFFKVGGLKNGADVKISGIKVGSVTHQYLDKEDFIAVVEMSIQDNIRLPVDTTAVIVGDGLLGNKYVKLEPGQAQDHIADGGELQKTQDYRSLEDSVSEIIFLATGSGEGEDE